jgi:hypothetical protein
LLVLLLLGGPPPATSGEPACAEGFDDVGTLLARGWIRRNNSEPAGPGQWTQGDPGVFPAWNGPGGSYAMAGADSATGPFPVVSNWLITPEIDFGPNEFGFRSFSFYTRAVPGTANRLVIRVCLEQAGPLDCDAPSGSSGDLGGFQTRLLDINPDLAPDGYPATWTPYWMTPGDGLPVVGRGRIAFHYYVFAQDGAYGTRIGLDEVAIAGATVCPFGEMIFIDGFDRS